MVDDRDNFEFRRKSQKVFVERGDVILRLHKTDIVRVRANGDVILSTGGWATPKTMKSMNDALELFGMWVETASGRTPAGRWQVGAVAGPVWHTGGQQQQQHASLQCSLQDTAHH